MPTKSEGYAPSELQAVLTDEQRAAGYWLQADDHTVTVCKRVLAFSASGATVAAIREAVERDRTGSFEAGYQAGYEAERRPLGA